MSFDTNPAAVLPAAISLLEQCYDFMRYGDLSDEERHELLARLATFLGKDYR